MRPGAALGLGCLAPAPVSRAQTYNRAALLRGFGIETYSQELCPGSSRKRCWAVSARAHKLLERQSKPRWLILHCSYRPSATGFVPGLTAFRSFRQRLSDKRSGICCPRASFSARHTGGNVELSSPAPDTRPLHGAMCGLGLSAPCRILCRSTTCAQQSHWEENTVCCCHNHSVLAPAHTA